MSPRIRLVRAGLGLAVIVSLALAATAFAATITIVNLDGAGEGFNDPTVVTPIGGNPGTTRGQQRLNVFQQAANVWGAVLPSAVTIRVEARFDALTPCDATSGVLGRAGPIQSFADFSGAEIPGTAYAAALANKLAGTDLNPGANDISAQFNTSVDNPTCLGASSWYYGYDGNEGTDVDLLPVVIHEIGHGLGFLSYANLTTGAFSTGVPDVYSRFLLDTSTGLHWNQMTNLQRVAASVNTGHVVWDGAYVTSRAPYFLGPRPLFRIDSPGAIAGEKVFGTAAFGPPLMPPLLSADVVLVDDATGTTTDGCEAIANAAQVNGKIALIDRGTCPFVQKVQNAAAAGAVAVIIANNIAGAPPLMGGADPGITIPSVSVTQGDGTAIKAQLATGVVATMGADPNELAGADIHRKVKMYAPNPAEPGSSISHWDVSAAPDLLMEPFISPDLTTDVDLTRWLFEDIGWFPRVASAPLADDWTLRLTPAAPNPFRSRTAIRFELDRPGLLELQVFDLAGRSVKKLMRAWQPAGSGAVTWDGTDETGRRVAPGVYLYRVKTGPTTETRRMVLMD